MALSVWIRRAPLVEIRVEGLGWTRAAVSTLRDKGEISLFLEWEDEDTEYFTCVPPEDFAKAIIRPEEIRFGDDAEATRIRLFDCVPAAIPPELQENQ